MAKQRKRLPCVDENYGQLEITPYVKKEKKSRKKKVGIMELSDGYLVKRHEVVEEGVRIKHEEAKRLFR